MARPQLLAQWVTLVDTLDLSVGDSPRETAQLNRTSFPLQQAKAMGASAHQIADFLEWAFRSYSRRAARVGLEGWFYAWCDELAGTLNCSACDVPTPDNLPFACRLDIRGDAAAVAEIAVRSPYTSGIPAAELKEVEWSDPDSDSTPLVLVVYAKQILRVALKH